MMEEPKCECCGKKAVKVVHSFADKGGTTDWIRNMEIWRK